MTILKYFFIFLSIMVFNALSIASNIQHKVVFNTNIEIDTLIASDGNIFFRIKSFDYTVANNEGMPELPVKLVSLIIPSNQEVSNISYSVNESSVISLNYPVYPVQKPIPTNVEYENHEFISPNKIVYNLNEQFPSKLAQVV